MFFRRNNRKSNEASQCEDMIAFTKVIADEKCRTSKTSTGFIWTQRECIQASQKVVEQIEECIRLSKK